jgi:antitoxin (DNA-binding transcriptional repressor) of toxin-antitoxin stability system
MQKVNIEEAKTCLSQLFEMALNGEEIYITKDENLSIQLVPHTKKKSKRVFGSAKGLIIMSEDFDEPLEEFKDYIK